MLRVPIARALVIETLRKLNAEDTTIVVVTHDEAIVSF
jgi:ABC-type lipoprotein export system ATPase subunit